MRLHEKLKYSIFSQIFMSDMASTMPMVIFLFNKFKINYQSHFLPILLNKIIVFIYNYNITYLTNILLFLVYTYILF